MLYSTHVQLHITWHVVPPQVFLMPVLFVCMTALQTTIHVLVLAALPFSCGTMPALPQQATGADSCFDNWLLLSTTLPGLHCKSRKATAQKTACAEAVGLTMQVGLLI